MAPVAAVVDELSTQLFLVDGGVLTSHRGRNDAKLNTSTSGWIAAALSTVRGVSATSDTVATVTGTTSGIEITRSSLSTPYEWMSPPLSAAATISGTVTFNLRMAESMSQANAGAQCMIERLDNTGGIVSTIVNSEQGSELGTSEAARNWTASPTSTDLVAGDRIRVRVAANDGGGTMATGFTVTLWFSGPTAAASGDSYVTFTENLTFLTADPSGSQLFPTLAASGIADQGAGVDEKDMWTSRGAGVDVAIRDTTAGWTAPLQWTTSAGGNTIEWYSHRLQAFTLSGLVKCNLRLSNSVSNSCSCNAELAVVNDDGTGASVFGSGGQIDQTGAISNVEGAETIYLAGPDISVTAGQRLRFRIRLDDGYIQAVTGRTATFYCAGTSGGASGDSWVTLTQTVTEFIVATQVPYVNQMPALIAQ